MMIQHCLRSWEDSKLPIGHGPSSVMAERTEEKREKTSEQVTLPQASSREMPQPDMRVGHLPKVNTTDQVKARKPPPPRHRTQWSRTDPPAQAEGVPLAR